MPSRLRKAPKRDLIGGTELEKQLHKKRMYAKTKRDTKDEIARTQHYLTYVPDDPEALEHLARSETYLKEDARPNYAKAETEVMSRFHGYGMCGGALVAKKMLGGWTIVDADDPEYALDDRIFGSKKDADKAIEREALVQEMRIFPRYDVDPQDRNRSPARRRAVNEPGVASRLDIAGKMLVLGKTQPPKAVRGKGGQLKKRPNETEDAYQQRLLRTQQQTERLAKAGITPEARQTAIQASAKVRQLKQMRDVLAQEASQQAYEQDPRTIAKRDAIAKREQENAIFNPLLKGLVDVAKAGSNLSFLPSQLREVGSMTADYLGSTMAEEEARTQQRLAEREAKMASVADYNADLARQREMAGNVSVSDLDRQIAEQQRLARGGAMGMPRFGEARYF